MPKVKQTPKLHKYLIEKGLLHSKNIELKKAATNAYWKEYFKNWQKEKRTREHSYRIFLTKEEQRLFAQTAKHLNLKIIALIKQSAIAYVSKTTIKNNSVELQEIMQILSAGIAPIIHALDENRITENHANALLIKMDTIQTSIEAIAHNTINYDNQSFE